MKMLSAITVSLILVGFLAAPAQSMAASQSYKYDALGRLIEVDYGGGKVVTYAYDKAGNRTSLSATGFPTTPPSKFVVLPLLGGLVLPIN